MVPGTPAALHLLLLPLHLLYLLHCSHIDATILVCLLAKILSSSSPPGSKWTPTPLE